MPTDHTLEEVGKQFDVTRERIRQIEAKALRKLRHPSRSEHLRSFLEMTNYWETLNDGLKPIVHDLKFSTSLFSY